MAMATERQIPYNPSFCMILLKDFPTRVPIPPNFIQNFGKEIPNKATLQVFTDKLWEVEVDVVKGAKNFYFQKGWEMFVENYNLEYGDFLIFTYYGNSMFKVEIFGKTGVEKKYFVDEDENSEPHETQENQKEKQIPMKDESNEFDDAEVEKNGIHIDSGLPDYDKITGKIWPKGKKRMKQKAVGEMASEWKSGNQTGFPEKAKDFSSQNPSFQVKITSAYLTKGYLSIPADFSRKYLQEEDVAIRVQTSSRTWNLKIYVRTTPESSKLFKIGGKWTKFVKGNDLKNGDTCTFEMIKSDDIVFRVYIHRC